MMFPKFVKSLLRLQRIMIDVLECPMGRLLDCILALSTQTYQMFDQTLTLDENIPNFVKLAANDLALMEHQKVNSFNPTLVSLGLKLAST